MAPAESIPGRHSACAVHLGGSQRHARGPDGSGHDADRPARQSPGQSVQPGESLLCGSAGILWRGFRQLHWQARVILWSAHRYPGADFQIPDRRDPRGGRSDRAAWKLGYDFERRLRAGGDAHHLHRLCSGQRPECGAGQQSVSRRPERQSESVLAVPEPRAGNARHRDFDPDFLLRHRLAAPGTVARRRPRARPGSRCALHTPR